jgi:hypothetical protein
VGKPDSGTYDAYEGLARADAEGGEKLVIFTNDNPLVLQLDIDKPYDWEQCTGEMWSLLLHKGIIESSLKTKSRGGNTHVYVELSRPLDLPTRSALQAALGSDLTRAALDMVRHIETPGSPGNSALYETAVEAERVEQWLRDIEKDQYLGPTF